MADRIALLHEGRIVQLATPEDLYRRPANVFAAMFVGVPKINLVEGRIEDNRLVPFGVIPPRELSTGDVGAIKIGLRPEAIELSGNGDYTAKVLSSEYLGDHYVATLDFQGHQLVVSKLTGEAPQNDQTVRFNIDKESLLYFDAESGRNLLCSPVQCQEDKV
ncbi:MAG: ABC transporter ATP-binding protein, partial [bacterium]|nr:ABC transporter ATP-binding protein [bacterium]